MTGIYVMDIKRFLDSGPSSARITCLVKSVTFGKSKRGSEYARATVCDSSATVNAVQWELGKEDKDAWKADVAVQLDVTRGEYNGQLQLNVVEIRPAPEDFPKESLYQHSPHPIEEMWAELLKTVHSFVGVLHEPSAVIVKALYDWMNDEAEIIPFHWEMFKESPAAKGMHHAYIGGLLEHTLGVTRMVKSICSERHAAVDEPLAIAAAVLHDIGKIDEYELCGEITSAGKFMGHCFIGAEWVSCWLREIGQEGTDVADNLVHCVISHHGRHEWGAAVEPKSPEAFVVHMADMLDVRLWEAERIRCEQGMSAWHESRVFGGEVFIA